MTAESPATFAEPDTPPGVSPRRLHRSRTNRVLAGVCGGIAEYYGSDPTAVRLATLVIGLFTGVVPMLIVYLIAALVVPEREGAPVSGVRSYETPGHGALVLGATLVVVGIAGFANVWLRVAWEQVWPLALIGFGAVIVVISLQTRK